LTAAASQSSEPRDYGQSEVTRATDERQAQFNKGIEGRLDETDAAIDSAIETLSRQRKRLKSWKRSD
jgi:hypothetical protein